jgi:hypothetical protein
MTSSAFEAGCPIRVKSGPDSSEGRLPVSPQQQTSLDRLGMSVSCQEATSVNDLVGAYSFGQPRFPKAFNEQLSLRVSLSTPSDPRGYCKSGFDF